MMRIREIAVGSVLAGLLAGGVLLTMRSPERLGLALSVDGRVAMLRAAFEQGNPEVSGSLLAHAGELDSTARGVSVGAVLVACRLGADCGAGALRTLELCVKQGWCADSVPAALEQGLGEHFAALDRLAAKAVQDSRP